MFFLNLISSKGSLLLIPHHTMTPAYAWQVCIRNSAQPRIRHSGVLKCYHWCFYLRPLPPGRPHSHHALLPPHPSPTTPNCYHAPFLTRPTPTMLHSHHAQLLPRRIPHTAHSHQTPLLPDPTPHYAPRQGHRSYVGPWAARKYLKLLI